MLLEKQDPNRDPDLENYPRGLTFEAQTSMDDMPSSYLGFTRFRVEGSGSRDPKP